MDLLHRARRRRLLALAVGLGVLLGASLSLGLDSRTEFAAATTVVSTGHGIDTCGAYSTTTWNQWYTATNDHNLGLYVGGTHGPCYHPNKTFFSNLTHYWGIIPIYDSLQAPCSGQSDPMSTSTSTAYNQGVTIADHVGDTLSGDGFTGAYIAYIDLEPFPNSSSCTAAPKAFVNGYVHELHTNGHKAGLYINATQPGGIPFAGIDNPPDAIWIADYNQKNSAAPDAVDTSGTRTTEWTHDQRMHQYDQNRSAQPSGVSTSVQYDPDAVDAPILQDNVP